MADPALGLNMKLTVDDSSIAQDVARAKTKAEAAGAATPGRGAAALLGMAGTTTTVADEQIIQRHQAMLEEKAKADAAYYANLEAVAKKTAAAEAEAMTRIGRETGGPTPGEINARTAAYAKMDDSLKGVRKRFTESAQEAGKWLGVAGAIGATATTFYALGNAIREGIIEYLKIGTERAADFKQALDLSDVQGSLKAYNDNLAELDAMMAERTAGSIRGWASSMLKSDEELQKEITQKRKDRDALQQVQDAARRRDERIKEKADAEAKAKEQAETKRRMQIEQRKKEIEDGKRFGEEAFQTEQDNLIGSLSERDRIIAEAAAKRRELEKKYNELGYKEAIANEDAFKRAREAINIERNRRIRELDEEQLKSAARVQQAWTNAFRAIRDENNKAFATDQAASMVQFAQQLRVEGMVAQAGMNRIVEGN